MQGNISQRLNQLSLSRQRISKGEFDLTNGTADEKSLIAEYQAPSAMFFNVDAATRLMFTTVEEFQTDGTADNTETFNLSNDIIETPNTSNIVLFEGTTRVQPDSVDYANNTFDYTDDGTGNYLHAMYVPRPDSLVEVRRQAPKSQGNISDVVMEEAMPLLHETDQNQDPPEFKTDSPLGVAVPKNWSVQIYADGPVPIEWDDSSESNSQGVESRNAVVSFPVGRAQGRVEGLPRAVRNYIANR